YCFVFFFFFQAEDGIRDYKVTGVQTCALPIYTLRFALAPQARVLQVLDEVMMNLFGNIKNCTAARDDIGVGKIRLLAWSLCIHRSEERRVGKECRSRRATYS